MGGGQRAAVRPLPVGSDHGRCRADSEEAESNRRRHRSRDDQHLPLRLLPAHQIGNQSCRHRRSENGMTAVLERKNFLRVVAASGAGLALGLEMSTVAEAAAPGATGAASAGTIAAPSFVRSLGSRWAETGSPPSSSTRPNSVRASSPRFRCASPKNSTFRCRACASAFPQSIRNTITPVARHRDRRQQEHAVDVAGHAQSRCDRARNAGVGSRDEMERRSRDVHDRECRRDRTGRAKSQVRRSADGRGCRAGGRRTSC